MNLLYIDPGTGSMLFSLVISLAVAASFGLRVLFLKLKFAASGGKKSKDELNSLNNIPFVIFSDHKRYWNVFKPVCDEFEARKINLVYYTASEDDPVFSANYQYIKPEFTGSGNKAFAMLNFLKADVVLSTTPSLQVYQWKRSKNAKFYVHIPHLIDDLTTYRMFGLDHYDAVMVNGPHQVERIRYFEKERNIPAKDLPVIGSTYMDSMQAKYNTLPSKEKNPVPVVLVAPSWGKSAILSKFGSNFISKLAATGYEIVIRPHPQSITSEADLLEKIKQETKDLSNVSWNFDNDNFNILHKADIMITDFSGVIFDYSMIFNGPVICADTSFDPRPYDADWLPEGDKIWSFKILPEISVQLKESEFDNMKQIIDNSLNSKDLDQSRLNIKNKYWLNQGGSAKAAADYLIEKQREITAKK